jgi:hypothetical protein
VIMACTAPSIPGRGSTVDNSGSRSTVIKALTDGTCPQLSNPVSTFEEGLETFAAPNDQIIRPVDGCKGLLLDFKGLLPDFEGLFFDFRGLVVHRKGLLVDANGPLLDSLEPHAHSAGSLLPFIWLCDHFRGLNDVALTEAIPTNPPLLHSTVIEACSSRSTMSSMAPLACSNRFRAKAMASLGQSIACTVRSAPMTMRPLPMTMHSKPTSPCSLGPRDRSKGALGHSIPLLLCSKGLRACSR